MTTTPRLDAQGRKCHHEGQPCEVCGQPATTVMPDQREHESGSGYIPPWHFRCADHPRRQLYFNLNGSVATYNATTRRFEKVTA